MFAVVRFVGPLFSINKLSTRKIFWRVMIILNRSNSMYNPRTAVLACACKPDDMFVQFVVVLSSIQSSLDYPNLEYPNLDYPNLDYPNLDYPNEQL